MLPGALQTVNGRVQEVRKENTPTRTISRCRVLTPRLMDNQPPPNVCGARCRQMLRYTLAKHIDRVHRGPGDGEPGAAESKQSRLGVDLLGRVQGHDGYRAHSVLRSAAKIRAIRAATSTAFSNER